MIYDQSKPLKYSKRCNVYSNREMMANIMKYSQKKASLSMELKFTIQTN